MPLVVWVKNHKLLTVLIIVLLFFFWRLSPLLGINTFNYTFPSSQQMAGSSGTADQSSVSFESSSIPFTNLSPSLPRVGGGSSNSSSNSRVVVKNSNLSLVVKDVKDSGDKIVSYAKDNGGYMVEASYNRPTESPFATITVRVPTEKLDEALKYFRSLGLKVTSENLVGTDVTDQYTDLEATITSLQKTKSKFEGFLDRATTLTDSVNIEREIISIQQQIDSYTGQKKALEENAKQTKVTAFLSTDELALPYTPDTSFRPAVVFKQAVRSLLNTLRIVGQLLIWVAVYSVIWVPVLASYFLLKRWKAKKAQVE